MRMGLDMSLRGLLSAVASSVYAAYALAERFTVPEYWVSGTQYSPITTLPGYSFTRSGTQGAVDASGAVQFFAPNVAAINSAGYHAYGALTNHALQSQSFGTTWAARGVCPVTENSTVAPDGTTTADTLALPADSNGGREQAGITTAGSSNTFSVFVKTASGTKGFSLQTFNGGTIQSSGTLTATTAWQRFTLHATHTNPSQLIIMSNGVAGDLIVWQAQVIAGNFPNGGPIITTTTAAVGIGASVFSHSPPAMPDADCMVWVTQTFQNVATDHFGLQISNAGETETITLYHTSAPVLRGYIQVGGVLVYDQSVAGAIVAGTQITFVMRRLSGSWRVGKIVAGVLTWATAGAAAMPTGLTKVSVGNTHTGALQTSGNVRGAFIKQATYTTDAEVLAAVAETA